jgi:hypothetical protein
MDVRDVRLGEGGHAGQHAVSVGNQIIAPIAHMHVVIRDRSFSKCSPFVRRSGARRALR